MELVTFLTGLVSKRRLHSTDPQSLLIGLVEGIFAVSTQVRFEPTKPNIH